MTPVEVFNSRRESALRKLSLERGLQWCQDYSDLADDLIRQTAGTVEGLDTSRLAVLAIGGYGRRELAPFSDVDLLFIPADDADSQLDSIVKRLHRALSDAFESARGTTFSYAFFLQNDAAALDSKTRTAMLDARFLLGSRRAFESFVAASRESLSIGDFLLEKIRERKAAKAKWNDTPLAVELHLKEGAGGLRSLHAANWVREVMGQPVLPPDEAFEHMIALRNLLHRVAERPHDHWSRPRQAEIAEQLGHPLAELVSLTSRAAETLERHWEDALAIIHQSDFAVSPGVQARRGVATPRKGASLSQAALGLSVAVELQLAIAPSPTCGVQIDGPEALHALASGEATLRRLDRAGVLARLLPSLEACRTLMPDDAIHAYSVFEHTLRTIAELDTFSPGGFYGGLRDSLADRNPLHLALLLHDVGKAVPDRPHSESGAEIAAKVCADWSLGGGISETVEWLVRHHLVMSRFIGMRDVSDPNVVQEFAAFVRDRERLDLLTLLTRADVGAVAPGTWTPAQDAFLRELHARTADVLESESAPVPDPDSMRRRLLRSLKGLPVEEDAVKRFLSLLPAQYAVNTFPALVPVHMEMVARAKQGEPSGVWDHDRDRGLSELTVCAIDRPGLLSQILGVLYAHDLSVFGLRAGTTAEPEGEAVALDTVLAAFGNNLVPAATCAVALKSLTDVLLGRRNLNDLLHAHGKDPDRKQEHFRFAFIEGTPGILEFQAPRGRGMAFRLSRMIWAQGWDIVTARFGQWAGRGAAAFYIHGPGGRPLSQSEVETSLAGKV